MSETDDFPLDPLFHVFMRLGDANITARYAEGVERMVKKENKINRLFISETVDEDGVSLEPK